MVYNLSGLYYRIFSVGLPLLALAIIFLLLWLFLWKKGKLILGVSILAIICSIIYTSSMLVKINNLEVEVYDGVFEDARRETHGAGFYPGAKNNNFKYNFLSDSSSKRTFYLDVFSKEKIYPLDFVEGDRYRIYYEKNTRIIVGVENLTKVP